LYKQQDDPEKIAQEDHIKENDGATETEPGDPGGGAMPACRQVIGSHADKEGNR